MANWTDTAIRGVGLWDQLDRYDDMSKYVEDELDQVKQDAVVGSKFTPFSVGGFGGSATATPDGGVNYQLAPSMRQESDNRWYDSAAAYSQAGQDPIFQTEDAYARIRAMQEPEEQRAMMATEARAAAQGRLGVSGANYGGSTPEFMAVQERIGQNQRAASMDALAEGRAYQTQQMNVGAGLMDAAYMPQTQLQNMYNQGLQGGQLAQAGQLAGANLGAQIGIGQIQSQVNNEKIRSELMAGLFNTIGGGFTDNSFDPIGMILDKIF